MQRAVDVACKFSLELFVIVNKYDLNRVVSRQIDVWCEERNIPVVAHLPFDNQIVDAMVAGKTIIEYNQDSEISRLIHDVYYRIVKG